MQYYIIRHSVQTARRRFCIINMKVLCALFLLFSLLWAQSTVITATQTACYSTCATCSGHPSNCTSCASTLVLVQGQCILSVDDGLLVNQFFPITQAPNSSISTFSLGDASTYLLGPCDYTESGVVRSQMIFIVPSTNLALAYEPSAVPPHSYLNIRFILMQRQWQTNDKLSVTFNANPSVVISTGPTATSQIICTSVPSYTAAIQYAFTDTSPSFQLTFTPNFTNPSNTQFGINSLMIRYGNCHPSCGVCFGPTKNNCTECQGYTLYNAVTKTCEGCSSGFYPVDNSCFPCHPSCLTCNGTGQTSCLSCNALFGTLTNGRCSLADSNQLIMFSDLTQNTFNSSNSWALSTAGTGQNIISQCGIESYLGGFPIATSNSFISKTFDLGPHFGVSVFFNLLIVDSILSTVAANYWIDQTVYSLTLNPVAGTNECGTTIPESLTTVSTGFQPHTNSSLYFRFRPLIASSSYYGIRNFFVIVQGCSSGCLTCNQSNTSQCLSCLSNFILVSGNCNNCPSGYYNNGSRCNPCSSFCLECSGPLMNQCKTCQYPFVGQGSICTIQPNYGIYSMNLNSANSPINADNSWYIYPNLQTRGNTMCGNTNIFGSNEVLYKGLHLQKNFTGLPAHSQITIHMNLYQIDNYDNSTLTLVFNGVPLNYEPVSYGSNICGNSSYDAVVKVLYTVPHNSNSFNLKVILNGRAKVGINNLVIFLQGCTSCANDFGYEIRAIPRYHYNIANTGIDVWAKFNKDYYNSTPFQGHFNGSIGPLNNVEIRGRLLQSTIPLGFDVLSTYNDIHLFTQPSQSSLNQPLNLASSSPIAITTQPNGNGHPLLNNNASFDLVRYDQLTPLGGTQRAVRNLYNFFYGFTSAILYISICSFFFGLGGAFEQFVMILQISFIHIFIMTDRMSLTLKVPLSGMKQIQFLNYFTDSVRNSIQNWLLPDNFWCKSPHVFEQYQKDINFVRAIYPIVMLILMYIVVFILMKLLFRLFKPRNSIISKNPYINYFRSVYERPVSYFDQLLRFVFITTIWASLLQFTHLTNSFVPFSGLNAWATIMFFVIAILYPACLTIYVWRQYVYMTNDQFYYLYQDIFFKRIRHQPPELNPHPYIYVATRFYILFLVLLVVAIPSYKYSPLGSLIPLLVLNALDIVYVICARIYTDPFCLAFKIIENSCLIILQILMLAMYGRGRYMSQNSFFALGYACIAFVVLMMINASIRMLYLIYTRVMMFLQTKYALDMQVLEENRINEAEKQLLRGRTRLFNNDAGVVNRLNQTRMDTRSYMGNRLPTQIIQNQMVQEMQYRGGSLEGPQPSINRIVY